MGTNGTSLLSHITTCRLCQQKFTAPPMDVPIIGDPPSAQTQRMLAALGKHIKNKHGSHWDTIEKGASEFGSLLMGLSFETTDPALLQLREATRYNIHMLTRRNTVGDESLEKKVSELAEVTPQTALALLKDLRDVLLEIGKYSPIQPPAA